MHGRRWRSPLLLLIIIIIIIIIIPTFTTTTTTLVSMMRGRSISGSAHLLLIPRARDHGRVAREELRTLTPTQPTW
jgi:hypothetical protein